jgi:hypothetical protein
VGPRDAAQRLGGLRRLRPAPSAGRTAQGAAGARRRELHRQPPGQNVHRHLIVRRVQPAPGAQRMLFVNLALALLHKLPLAS